MFHDDVTQYTNRPSHVCPALDPFLIFALGKRLPLASRKVVFHSSTFLCMKMHLKLSCCSARIPTRKSSAIDRDDCTKQNVTQHKFGSGNERHQWISRVARSWKTTHQTRNLKFRVLQDILVLREKHETKCGVACVCLRPEIPRRTQFATHR